MEFLYKLYSNDFFGIGLFIVITILAFSFLIILFFGKKDEKARNNLEKENNIKNDNEVQNNNLKEEVVVKEELQTESLESVNVPTEEVVEPVLENSEEKPVEVSEIIETSNSFEPLESSNLVLNTDLVSEEINNDPIIEQNENDWPEVEESFNIETPISLDETENLEFSNQEESFIKDEDPFVLDSPIIEEPETNDIFSEEEEVEDIPKRTAMPTQFSSVYLSKEKEENIEDEMIEEEEIAPIPLRSNFDLPKPFDLPKLNKTSNNENSLNKILDDTDEDSYNIDR